MTVELSRGDGVAVLTLASPPVNALSKTLVRALHAALDQVEADAEIRVLHVRSALKVFCAGADLAEMRANLARPDLIDTQIAAVRDMQGLLQRIESLALTTVAEIGGAALGGGLELALACDLRVAANAAKLALPECNLGLIPGAGGTQRLTALCGTAIAKRLILGAEILDGATAQDLGLAHWSVARENVAGFVADLTARLAKIPRAAAAAAKSCIAAYADPARDGFEEELQQTKYLLLNESETRARVDAFLSNKS
ncbi:enoyl-CoA hydratase [Rhodoblastus sphagnicola]|uniref:Enoyl-CoA hydratase n=1 Tax=Rhodoblastus sphagnicola TaxID=333368 RepID=A0A2S6MXB9_9HYPH|nr:enoyl-CoA hydratase/isomerase family protein [Rhodoblastus sphagnicola]MBB4199242.1 enoyl-CoA hydratase/carnithine racemase [Rhodoblastus sphagnicola]PPQ27000.1 enoyl-CoA hydratase [Rhodoblastus sphagnicola]